ncbi:HD domain-containing phosphohydrolase [Marinobacterium arenosum]|uniref:HD domain-containing phosphohydrolase n=1 Tax=Marinobacterium arenosum TaxID=2862496 RepID=UPI001C975C43|nr:HD domain-containing phosphohydrolase [Marinobacterium arenosum]MBY4677933.1 HD domain-containing protein [Marinobacterium arenosum]
MFWRRKSDNSPTNRQHAQGLLTSLYVMATMVEARDPYTGGHLWRVSQYCRLVAEKLGLPTDEVARISLGGFLHDLGKVGVPDEILRKPGRLTDQEYDLIKTHPEVGARLLAGHPLAELVMSAVLQHHEMPNGRGYPQGLSGTQLPLEARIVGVCDAFDAMTSHRPYRAGMPLAKALAIIEGEQGNQFDTEAAQALVALARSGQLDSIRGHSDDGIPLQECPMCGPTILIRRDQQPGELTCCRNCGAEAEIVEQQGRLVIEPTGRQASQSALAPQADLALIDSLLTIVVEHLRLPTKS